MVKKIISKSNGAEKSHELTLEEALDIIFNTKLRFSSNNIMQICNGSSNGSKNTVHMTKAEDFLNRKFHATVRPL